MRGRRTKVTPRHGAYTVAGRCAFLGQHVSVLVLRLRRDDGIKLPDSGVSSLGPALGDPVATRHVPSREEREIHGQSCSPDAAKDVVFRDESRRRRDSHGYTGVVLEFLVSQLALDLVSPDGTSTSPWFPQGYG